MCALPIESGGPCWAHAKKWGFNKDMKECREFFYAGCGGLLTEATGVEFSSPGHPEVTIFQIRSQVGTIT